MSRLDLPACETCSHYCPIDWINGFCKGETSPRLDRHVTAAHRLACHSELEEMGPDSELIAAAKAMAATQPGEARRRELVIFVRHLASLADHLASQADADPHGEWLLDEASALLRKAADKLICAHGAGFPSFAA